MTYVIGLGANLGDRQKAFGAAIAAIDALPGSKVTRISRFHETEPLGPPQPRFLNGAIRVETSLSPRELLDALLEIERALGRVRDLRWGPRSIDLDILWSNGPEVHEAGLTIPHPELIRRAFALGPLIEVAPEAGPTYIEHLHALGPASKTNTP